jgi:primosomal protein N'
MRNLAFRSLAAGMVLVLVSPAFAQRGQRGGGGFGGPMDPAMVILQAPVQEEIKANETQKAELQKIQEKFRGSMREAFQSAGGDREKVQEAMKSLSESTKKEIEKVKETLKPEQTKRLHQLEIQFAGIRAFNEPKVLEELKLNDKQKSEIKEIAESIAKDSKELRDGAQGDRAKMQEVGRKIQALNKEGMEKIAGALSEDQKKTWTEMIGEKFDKFEQGGRPRGPGNRQRQTPGGNNS